MSTKARISVGMVILFIALLLSSLTGVAFAAVSNSDTASANHQLLQDVQVQTKNLAQDRKDGLAVTQHIEQQLSTLCSRTGGPC